MEAWRVGTDAADLRTAVRAGRNVVLQPCWYMTSIPLQVVYIDGIVFNIWADELAEVIFNPDTFAAEYNVKLTLEVFRGDGWLGTLEIESHMGYSRHCYWGTTRTGALIGLLHALVHNLCEDPRLPGRRVHGQSENDT